MMERINLGYSVKNIPFTNERKYKLKLVEKIEAIIKRMRWKAIFCNTPSEERQPNIETYGLKSSNCPRQVKELIPFENDLMQLAKDIKFRRTNNDFQVRLKEDIRNITNSGKTLTAADKTSNMYKLSKDQYNHLKQNAITSTYKKTSSKVKEEIDRNGLEFAKKAGIPERMDINGTNTCFITIKDHKQNFQNNPTTRLINPAKNEIGRISKVVLDKINSNLRNHLGVNQWKSTNNVINWFRNISDKKNHTFTMFDIKDFYPSIKENLLRNALSFAKRHIAVSKEDIDIIFHARKSLLFNDNETWMKKNGGLFDVTMGAFDGAEVCELVGTYLLNLIGNKYNSSDIGLYRDDGLAVFKNTSGPQNEKIKKEFQKIFRDNDLDIIITCNMKVVDYLDVTLNLDDGTFRPFRKPDDETNYIHCDSDHPPNIIKQLPISIEKRLSSLSSSKEIFDQSKTHYQDALRKSGHTYDLKYNPVTENNRRRRRRNVIWFNPPYSKRVSTNVGKIFLTLIDKHFPRNHKFRKLFNRNNVKVSYACMPNVRSVINAHNRKILEEKQQLALGSCNCNDNSNCPLDGHCLTSNALYQAEVGSDIDNYDKKVYKGCTEPVFKSRYGNHRKAFNNDKYKNDTELSKEVWKIKERKANYNIKWSVIKQYPAYNQNNKRCMLCLNEKLAILEHEGENLLNKRSEIISKCRHQNKYKLSNLTSRHAIASEDIT